MYILPSIPSLAILYLCIPFLLWLMILSLRQKNVKGGYIGDYTQVGVHSVILPTVKIGENCVIGANSVVNKRLEDFSFAMG